ncbi:PQQ-dependent dehydrogenase, methanol/ethanol family [Bradyrhizobium manausense]|nr:PQQ-dependent dehydrogenase, methanol/ethanol family [Bradyrhizobium tropiciagri]MBR0687855.1 PQQ-dependent dehydrogenase, methanol/ethanol family [Bradyrhizobium manausense]MBR0898843.1 PQQ-dependent dehydrogenase, methanol/ethanol family [Bradyrhizobium tropiciagri]
MKSRLRRTAATAMVLAGVCAGYTNARADSGDEWVTYGGDTSNTRYSTLSQINTQNVTGLRVAWMRSLGSLESQESTPLVINGVMYVTSSAGPKTIFALNAKDGSIKWTYEPDIPEDFKQYTCCGIGNRGLAYKDGKLFVGRLDSKLTALDAETGRELWTTQVNDYKQGAGITSPPMLIKDLVITGYTGGEFGVRGALQAYKQSDGSLVWRTYSTPLPGEPGSETWKGDSGKNGGGTFWNVGAYDAKLNLLYWGTGNAGPWSTEPRGASKPDIGQYTNLHTASTLALNPETGKIVWSYQDTPADAWDYDGVNEQVLADIDIKGRVEHTLLKAGRNGFFYVMNRETGKIISAKPYVETNWATGVDPESGRPIEGVGKRPFLNVWAKDVCPSLFGGKQWPPVSYSPDTGLVYIPAMEMCMDIMGKEEQKKTGKFYLGADFRMDTPPQRPDPGRLLAWDPVNQKTAWVIKEDLPLLGGTMTTKGGLVFYGNIRGFLHAVDAKSGQVLWKFNLGTGVNQSPITYMIDGKQYLAVVAGRGAGAVSFMGKAGERAIAASPLGGYVVVFALDK